MNLGECRSVLKTQPGDMVHYMDDILVGSEIESEMIEKLERIFEILVSVIFSTYYSFFGLSVSRRWNPAWQFIPAYSVISEPLRQLLRKDDVFRWSDLRQKAF